MALADCQCHLAGGCGDGGFQHRDVAYVGVRGHLAAVFAATRIVEVGPEQARAVWLRLDRHDAAAERAQRAGAVADVRADIEGQSARTDELPIEAPQPALPARDAVVDEERAAEAVRSTQLAHRQGHTLILR